MSRVIRGNQLGWERRRAFQVNSSPYISVCGRCGGKEEDGRVEAGQGRLLCNIFYS